MLEYITGNPVYDLIVLGSLIILLVLTRIGEKIYKKRKRKQEHSKNSRWPHI